MAKGVKKKSTKKWTIFDSVYVSLMALVATIYAPIYTSILWLFFGLMLTIPPTKNFIHSKIGIGERPIKIIRIIMIVLLVVSSLILVRRFQAYKIQEEVQKKVIRAHKIVRMERIKKIAYFNSHRSAILRKLRSDLHAGMFEKVIALSSEYIPVINKDKDLTSINHEAKRKLRNRELITALKKTPSSDYKERMSLYHQLSTNNPHIALYAKKYTHYKGLIAKAKRKRARFIAKFGEPPIYSSWNSYHEIKDYLKQRVYFPLSIKVYDCGQPFYSYEGWIVTCRVQGKNTFGGLIHHIETFTFRHGQIINEQINE